MRPVNLLMLATGALALVGCNEHEVAHAEKVLAQHRVVGVSLNPPRALIEKGGYRGGGAEEISAEARAAARDRAAALMRDGATGVKPETAAVPTPPPNVAMPTVEISGRAAYQRF